MTPSDHIEYKRLSVKKKLIEVALPLEAINKARSVPGEEVAV
jgi:hypothetical protein